MSSNSSREFQTGGNTITPVKRQISPAKRWLFVLNNYSEDEVSSIVPIIDEHCKVGIIGYEGYQEGKTPHLQGYFELKTNKIRPMALFNNKRIHFGDKNGKSCKGSEADNVNYCSKEGRVFYRKGIREPTRTIKREDFYLWQENLVRIFEKTCEWDCRKIYWRYGGMGIGKTQFCKWLCMHLGAVIIGGEARHMLAQVQNAKAPIYIILLAYGDEKVSYRAIEKIKDGLFTSCFGTDNNKMHMENASHLLIIGNEEPDYDDRHFHPEKYDVEEIFKIIRDDNIKITRSELVETTSVPCNI